MVGRNRRGANTSTARVTFMELLDSIANLVTLARAQTAMLTQLTTDYAELSERVARLERRESPPRQPERGGI